jgi:acid stress-induced BolA-like protein IbaG/YrbA
MLTGAALRRRRRLSRTGARRCRVTSGTGAPGVGLRAPPTSGRAAWYASRQMSSHPTSFTGDIPTAIRDAVLARIPDAIVEVVGGGGHWSLTVTSAAFADRSMLERHRLVLGSIAALMAGNEPPIHAVDSLITKTP